MELIVIEILPGRDVVEHLINVAQSHQAGITVLSGSGLVSNATNGFSVERPFNMISLMGTYINPIIGQASSSMLNSYFSIFVSSGEQGRVFGGIVEGKIIAAGIVKITAALIKKPEFHRLGNINGNHYEMQDDMLPVINTDNKE